MASKTLCHFALSLLYLLCFTRCGDAAKTQAGKTARPEFHQTYEIRLPFTGTLNSSKSSLYSSSVPNKNMKITRLVDEGVFVEKGDLLVQLDDSELRWELRELANKRLELEQEKQKSQEEYELNVIALNEAVAEADFNATQALKKLEHFIDFEGPAKLKQLEQERHLDTLKLRRLQREKESLELLRKKGHVTSFELDNHEEQLLQARYSLDGTEANLSAFNKYGMHDEKMTLENESRLMDQKYVQFETHQQLFREQQTNRIKRFAKRLKQNLLDKAEKEKHITGSQLFAQHAGLVIYRKSYRDGKEVKPALGFAYRRTQPILQIQDIRHLIASTRINEYLLNKVTVGMPVDVVADARQNDPFSGEVSFIGLLAERKTEDAEKAFDMNIQIEAPPAGLRPGMSVRCEVMTRTFQKVWTLPRKCVTTKGENGSCLVLRAGQQLSLNVQIIDYDQQTAILSGNFMDKDVVFFN